jgi:hypothetical protein
MNVEKNKKIESVHVSFLYVKSHQISNHTKIWSLFNDFLSPIIVCYIFSFYIIYIMPPEVC